MATPPTRASISGTPSRATANTGFGALWDYVTGLLGSTGNAAEARTALGATATGSSLFTTASASAARTTLGSAATGDALFQAATAAAARTTLGVPDSGPAAGLRNLIINGNFAINQRAYVSGTATGGANQYTLDRWRVVTSGQNATFVAAGNGNTVTAPAGGLEQVIEGLSVAGGTYVINWTGTATCTVGGTSRAKGATFTLTANTNVTIRFTSGTVGEVQVEPGSVATPFEPRPYGLELALCRRYYEARRYVLGVARVLGVASWETSKRATPTLTLTPDAGTGGTVAATDASGFYQSANHSGDTLATVIGSAEL